MSADRITALLQALELTPDNHPLRLLLAEMLQSAGQIQEAIQQYEILLSAGQLPPQYLLGAGELAVAADRLDLAAHCLDQALKAGLVDGTAALQAKIDAKHAEKGMIRVLLPVAAGPGGAPAVSGLEKREKVTFADVGGLEEVKKVIHRLIILPLMRPDIYWRYGRQAGGGVLFLGPPGCGKTLLARATAGECKLPFFNVRIEDILDPWFGVSERNLHAAFTEARAKAPCVLLIDELDALAYARRKQQGQVGRALVDQMLQELDAIGAENRQVLIMAATNAPWDVDEALLRPGRFDRRIFVPPPDAEARYQILKILLASLPVANLDLHQIAKKAELFSGADLKALVEQAVDQVIEEALESQAEPPITMKHLERALVGLRPTTLEWLSRAQNYVEFANQDERYQEIADFLKAPEVRSRKL